MDKRRHLTAFFLLFVITALIYSNSLENSWHFDDYGNILRNRAIHIKSLDLKSLAEIFAAKDLPGQVLRRPAAYLSFAVNWYFGKEDVKGYHLVNIVLHVFVAFFVYATLLSLFSTPVLRESDVDAFSTALVASVLWAANPVQTQAVNLIVQRMAQMAALFYTAGIFFYLKTRMAARFRPLFAILTLLSFLLAAASKENALTFPFALICVEMIFFGAGRKKMILLAYFAVAYLIFLFSISDSIDAFSGYARRPYTIDERLFTQARTIFFYLGLIFYPLPSRLNMDHPINISASLTSPPNTLICMIAIPFLLAGAVLYRKKEPLVAFAVIFFFLAHGVESTLLPLELVFEHRNYLPSVFLFAPIAALILRTMKRRPRLVRLLGLFICVLIMSWGIGSYLRNKDWRSEKSLWEDTLAKNPESERALHNLANTYYMRINDFDTAFMLFKAALDKKSVHTVYSKALILNNLAGIFYLSGNYEKAANLFKAAVQIRPEYDAGLFRLAQSEIRLMRWDDAYRRLKILVERSPLNVRFLNLISFVALKKQDPALSLEYSKKSIQVERKNPFAWLNLGAAMFRVGRMKQAEFALLMAVSLEHDSMMPYLYLSDFYIAGGRKKDAGSLLDKLLERIPVDTLLTDAGLILDETFSLAVDPEAVLRLIDERIEAAAKRLRG